MKYHKWNEDNICKKCGLEKRLNALTPNLRTFGGKYLPEYKVNNEWVRKAPSCI